MNIRKVGLAGVLIAFLASSAGAETLSVENARTIVTPFYEALNRPAGIDAVKPIEQTTSSDWMTCGGNDACIPRGKFIDGFKDRGSALPALKWKIKEILIAGDRIIVRGEASGTPSGAFLRYRRRLARMRRSKIANEPAGSRGDRPAIPRPSALL